MTGFLFKKAIKKRVDELTDSQKENILEILKEHPDFLEELLGEIETKTSRGDDIQKAIKESVEKNQKQLIEIFKEERLIK
jgi:hypothetical protein